MLPIPPQDAVKIVLKNLLSRRSRDVLEKRFGLKGGKKTLEAIGGEYKITRERVRQIETDALKQLSRRSKDPQVEGFLQKAEDHLRHHGGVMAEHQLLTTLVDHRSGPHLLFLMHLGGAFCGLPETDYYHRRWAVGKEAAATAEKIMAGVHDDLGQESKPVPPEKLRAVIAHHAQNITGEAPPERVLDSYSGTSKVIRQNTYGEYGLASWPTISPRGVRDKAYLVLAKAGKPLHFLEVAKSITGARWSKKKAHPQTVHNELIKDPRFVLVGRGLYALREWGYEPGLVRDVLVSVLKGAGRAMAQEEIVRLVSEKRFVKPQTVLLNLQNKSLFKRTEEGKYTLV